MFFIARIRGDPDLKGRNFFKSTVRGKETAVAMSSKLVPSRFKSIDATATSVTERGLGETSRESKQEELPSWQRGAGGALARKVRSCAIKQVSVLKGRRTGNAVQMCNDLRGMFGFLD